MSWNRGWQGSECERFIKEILMYKRNLFDELMEGIKAMRLRSAKKPADAISNSAACVRTNDVRCADAPLHSMNSRRKLSEE